MPNFELTITDAGRIEEFKHIFGTNTVPVVSPFARWADLDGRGEELVYRLGFVAITEEQRV